jgi:hypothetical protein
VRYGSLDDASQGDWLVTDGMGVGKAIVRFQSCNADLILDVGFRSHSLSIRMVVFHCPFLPRERPLVPSIPQTLLQGLLT